MSNVLMELQLIHFTEIEIGVCFNPCSHLSIPPCSSVGSFSHGRAPDSHKPRLCSAAHFAPSTQPTPTMMTLRLRESPKPHLELRRRHRRSPKTSLPRSAPTSRHTPTFPSTFGTRTRRLTRFGSPLDSASPPGFRPLALAALIGLGTASPPPPHTPKGTERMFMAVRVVGMRCLARRCRKRRWRSSWSGTGTAIAPGRSIWVSS